MLTAFSGWIYPDIPRTHYLNFKPSKQLDEANLELVSPMIKNSFPVNYNHAVM